MTTPRRILVIRWGRLGDLVLTAAATRELASAFPGASIELAVKEEYLETGRLLPGIETVHPFAGGGPAALIAYRRKRLASRYDLVIDLHGNTRSRFLAFLLLGAKKTIYPRLSVKRRALVKWKRGKEGNWKPVWERYLDGVEKAGVKVKREPPRIDLPDKGGDRGMIVIAPGAGRPNKRLPRDRFAEAARILSKKTGRPIFLVGSAGEKPLLDTIHNLAGADLSVCAGLPITETAQRLGRASLLITNDSGLMHLANAVETPVVALFGPTVPELGFGPTGVRDRVLSIDLPCRPCSLHGEERCPIPERHHECLTGITTEEIVGAACAILDDEMMRER